MNNDKNISRRDAGETALSHSARNVGWLVAIIALAVIVADQAMKIWVKTSFYMGEDLALTSWFHLKFIENNGMAFGLELTSKIVLTLGRMLAVGLFVWLIVKLRDVAGLRRGFWVAVAMITAGAAGNIFDCVFYGRIFNNPLAPDIAVMFPEGGGYADWFEGRVVDMLYFSFFDFYWPEWIPVIGGRYFEFFQYIFNIADASICIGVCLLIFFYSSDASKAFGMLGNDSGDDEESPERRRQRKAKEKLK